MALRYSFGLGEAADRLDAAIATCWRAACAPPTSAPKGSRVVSTREMGDAIVAAFERGA